MAYKGEKELAEALRKAFPLRKAPEPFRQKLKQELSQMQIRQKKNNLLKAAAAIAAVFILVLALQSLDVLPPNGQNNPQTPKTPNSPLEPPVNLPALPPLTATGPITGGASPGPGFEVELTYERGPLNALPTEAKAFRFRAVPFSEEALAAAAAKLGITGEITEELWQDSKTYQIGDPENGMMIIFPNGYYSYARPLPAELQGQSLPAEKEIIQAAREFLIKIGIDPAKAAAKKVELPEAGSYYSLAHVTFIPKEPGPQISISPFARIQVAPGGEVHNAGWVWPTELESSASYPLRSAEAAWQDIEDGKGIIAISYDQVPGPVEGVIAEGHGKIEENFIGYILTYDQDYNVVMQPVAAFRGTATFADGTSVPFTVYTKAIDPGYYEQ